MHICCSRQHQHQRQSKIDKVAKRKMKIGGRQRQRSPRRQTKTSTKTWTSFVAGWDQKNHKTLLAKVLKMSNKAKSRLGSLVPKEYSLATLHNESIPLIMFIRHITVIHCSCWTVFLFISLKLFSSSPFCLQVLTPLITSFQFAHCLERWWWWREAQDQRQQEKDNNRVFGSWRSSHYCAHRQHLSSTSSLAF